MKIERMYCCPKCGGEGGYQYEMKVTHIMNSPWGKDAECVDSGETTQSLVNCVDCGARFQLAALERLGLMGDASQQVEQAEWPNG